MSVGGVYVCVYIYTQRFILTINVQLILKVGEFIFCPRQKKISSELSESEVHTLVFLCPKARERGRRERKEKKSASNYISQPPGPE
jgi:hypothetical protein